MAAERARRRTSRPDFVQMGSAPVGWADGLGEAALTRWRSKEGLVDQITACRRTQGPHILIFTATHPAPMPSHAFASLLAAIASFRPHARS